MTSPYSARSEPVHRLADAYATGSYPGQHVRQRIASTFQHDPQIETWISWQTMDPTRYSGIPAHMLIAIGHYQQAKQAATGEAAHQHLEQARGPQDAT